MKQMIEEIEKLKKEKNAIILAHYYVPDEVQAIADYVGDSFYLAKVAVKTTAEVLVFAGVSFMGESAKMLNPEKTVLMPDLTADCPMAHMADAKKIKEMREKYEDLAVVCYINSDGALKELSDVCVTSANAVEIVRKLPNQNIYFIPDQNLGSYVARQVPEKNVILNDGYCPIHKNISAEEVKRSKEQHPDAELLVHPECTGEILVLADYIGSTSQIIDYAGKSEKQEFLIGTEDGVLYELRMKNPEKKFYPAAEGQCCPGMKLNTLEKLLDCLKENKNQVEVTKELQENANRPLNRMLEMTR